MRGRTVLIAALAALASAAPAGAQGTATMPLSQVQPGMQCTVYSVFRGQEVQTFDAEILDVVGEASNGSQDPRLLIRVSGPLVDATGVGPGFSGSPLYCPVGDGTFANAGAISETIGEYGNHTVLATPIEQVLGTPVTPVRPAKPNSRAARAEADADAALLARAEPMAAPITIAGASRSIVRGLAKAAAKRGIQVMAAPPVPSDSAPSLPFQPGSAVSVGMSSGDLTIGATGTVTYVDGANVWAFGHPFDGVGGRSLFLQDAYVASIIYNPLQGADFPGTYKLAGALRDRGLISNDGRNAIAGTEGVFPPSTTVRVYTTDEDTGKTGEMLVNVADETDVDNPTAFSNLGFIGPVAIAEGVTNTANSVGAQLSGRMCFQVRIREAKEPMRFCNRYVSDGTTPSGDGVGGNGVALSAATDASSALALFDVYKGKPIHVTEMTARVSLTRGQRQTYMRKLTLPRTVRAGSTVQAKLVVQVVRGARRTITFPFQVPNRWRKGTRHRVSLVGADPDSEFGFFDEIVIDLSGEGDEEVYDTEGPRTVKALRKAFKGFDYYDGIRTRSGRRVYADPTYRIGGTADTRVRVR